VGTGPLHLIVHWPVEEGSLELIASNRNPIRSLVVQDTGRDAIDWYQFTNLNLNSLRSLSLEHLQDMDIKRILDLVLQFNPLALELSFTDYLEMSDFGSLLTHELLHRVIDLTVDLGQ
jgi:hypothetical protein